MAKTKTISTDETGIQVVPKRHINLRKREREEFAHKQQIELAISLFLDLGQDRTVAQIAAEMGMDVSSLKRLTNDPAFQMTYDSVLMNLGHHPRLQAAQSQLPDLLPLANNALRRILTDPRVAATATVAAIKLLYETVNMQDVVAREDPGALDTFMKSRGVTIGGDLVVNLNLPIPDEYKKAFHKMMRPDSHIIDGVTSSVDSSAPTNEGAASVPRQPFPPPGEASQSEDVPS